MLYLITHLVCPLQKAACMTKSHALHLAFRPTPPGHHLPTGPNYDLCTTPNALPLHYIIPDLRVGHGQSLLKHYAWSPTHTATKILLSNSQNINLVFLFAQQLHRYSNFFFKIFVCQMKFAMLSCPCWPQKAAP